MESLIQSGSAELCGMMNQDFSCMLTSREVFSKIRLKYNSECISTTVKHGGRSVMAWGAFSAAGTGELLHCEKSINALEYRRILQKGLLPTIEKFFLKQNNQMLFFNKTILLLTTKTWLENKYLRLMFWSGQSPDLNHIENI